MELAFSEQDIKFVANVLAKSSSESQSSVAVDIMDLSIQPFVPHTWNLRVDKITINLIDSCFEIQPNYQGDFKIYLANVEGGLHRKSAATQSVQIKLENISFTQIDDDGLIGQVLLLQQPDTPGMIFDFSSTANVLTPTQFNSSSDTSVISRSNEALFQNWKIKCPLDFTRLLMFYASIVQKLLPASKDSVSSKSGSMKIMLKNCELELDAPKFDCTYVIKSSEITYDQKILEMRSSFD